LQHPVHNVTAAVHANTPAPRRLWSLSALALAILYAADVTRRLLRWTLIANGVLSPVAARGNGGLSARNVAPEQADAAK
jgi:hypothetical protein